MKLILYTLLFLLSYGTTIAQDTDSLRALRQRVNALEERTAQLEQRAARIQITPEARKMMEIARQHVAQERQQFNAEDIENAERLYRNASGKLRNEESKILLDSIVSVYPRLNRAGCAQLYRAQQESGAEKERLLKDCIERFSACYYLDGAQVGPLAMFQLANYYREAGRKQDSRKLFRRLRSESPEAVSHSGKLLADNIK